MQAARMEQSCPISIGRAGAHVCYRNFVYINSLDCRTLALARAEQFSFQVESRGRQNLKTDRANPRFRGT